MQHNLAITSLRGAPSVPQKIEDPVELPQAHPTLFMSLIPRLYFLVSKDYKKMGPLPYGPGTGHIKASHGPDTMASKFYITEYSSKLGIEGFTPRPGVHRGTGYQSNFRPGVYYNRRIDEVDNPNMG